MLAFPRLSIAPMMDRTDRHYRVMMRQLTRQTLLHTEMVVTGAILRGDRERFLAFDPCERPLSLQLGGDDPEQLAACAAIAEDYGYDAVNLNVGCPSERVRDGNFGACLMATPERVAAAVAGMRARVRIPVTVKHRIGVDEHQDYEFMAAFVERVAAAGCQHFTVHARVAILKGLSPAQNRTVPPLRYDEVFRLKREHPALHIELNGGVTSLAAAATHLEQVDAVMLGRAAYDDPYLFAAADRFLGGDFAPIDRATVVEAMIPFAEAHLRRGGRLSAIARHLGGLFRGEPQARAWRRLLSERGRDPSVGPELLRELATLVRTAARRNAA